MLNLESPNTVLSVENLTKRYNNIPALQRATLAFETGEIHALLGENGAGKSTLCKMLSGAIQPDEGVIRFNGKEFSSFTPSQAMSEGIGMIYQEFNLVAEMTVYENMFLGKEIKKGLSIDKAKMIEASKEVFKRLNITIDPEANIKDLSVAYSQLVEISKAILEECKVLIMDEPTAPLTTQEVDALFELVRSLKKNGVTIIFISHRIEELLDITDRITVMRDSEIISTVKTSETNREELIKLMVGRELGKEFPKIENNGKTGECVLKVKGLTTTKIKDISFELYTGEILGLAGLVGAGRTEVLRAIFGADPIISGEIWVRGKKVDIKSPSDAIANGIALIPEDRKRQGLNLQMTILQNMSMVKIADWSRFFTINRAKEKAFIEAFVEKLAIKFGSLHNLVTSLSGGNQQKVVLSKWLATGADIIFFDEPTRGIDVGAKKEIYDQLDRLKNEGKAIIMVSSEMVEVIGMCNRVIVMHEGEYAGELPAAEISQVKILELASGNA